jgi:AbrB family looped-hinge helix DNA binding protein
METAKLSSKHQITVPKPIRHKLGVQKGERLRFRELQDGHIIVEPAEGIKKSDGAARKRLSESHQTEVPSATDAIIMDWLHAEENRVRTTS